MSVKIIDAESCAKIADYICKGESDEQKENIFIELRAANINEWNKEYPASNIGILDAVKMLETYKPNRFVSIVQACKTLHCWKYNSDRSSSVWERVNEFLQKNFKYSDVTAPGFKGAAWE